MNKSRIIALFLVFLLLPVLFAIRTISSHYVQKQREQVLSEINNWAEAYLPNASKPIILDENNAALCLTNLDANSSDEETKTAFLKASERTSFLPSTRLSTNILPAGASEDWPLWQAVSKVRHLEYNAWLQYPLWYKIDATHGPLAPLQWNSFSLTVLPHLLRKTNPSQTALTQVFQKSDRSGWNRILAAHVNRDTIEAYKNQTSHKPKSTSFLQHFQDATREAEILFQSGNTPRWNYATQAHELTKQMANHPRELFAHYATHANALSPIHTYYAHFAAYYHLAAPTIVLRQGIALHLYRAEHGELPETLDALSPYFNGSLPRDPYRETPLVYRRQEDTFLLYSVGKNGTDDQTQKDDIVWGGRIDGK